jgi:hypothetical protein
MSDLTLKQEAAAAEAAAALPAWFYEQQIKSLTGLIDADIAQREALVRWIATIGNLLQAGAKLIWCGVLLLPALFQALRYLVWLSIDHTPPPVPQGAQRGAFQASIDDLTETMKD